jgi:hypothetical protein
MKNKTEEQKILDELSDYIYKPKKRHMNQVPLKKDINDFAISEEELNRLLKQDSDDT